LGDSAVSGEFRPLSSKIGNFATDAREHRHESGELPPRFTSSRFPLGTPRGSLPARSAPLCPGWIVRKCGNSPITVRPPRVPSWLNPICVLVDSFVWFRDGTHANGVPFATQAW